MNIIPSIHCCLFYLFTCIGLLQAEGFLAGTLIKTNAGYTVVEQLEIGNPVISPSHKYVAEEHPITNVTHCTINCYVKISVENEHIYVAPNQKFYSYNQQQWIPAHELKRTDLLVSCEGNKISINSVEIIHKQCTIYLLSVKTNHVSSHKIIAHNSPEVFLCIYSSLAPTIIQTGLAICATLFGTHLAQKISKKHQLKAIDTANINSCVGGGGGWHDPKDDKEQYPHGIYKESPVHRSKKCGRKSPSPKNGQKCLDHSLPSKGNSTQRISIEEDNFVVLKQTMHREFHGYCVTWNELHWSLQQVLKDHQLVTNTGKIIKEAVSKVFK